MNSKLKKLRGEEHPGCLLCGQSHPRGMKLDFELREDGSVEAMVRVSKALEGYRGMLHGGVIAALLDSAMTNCLFARGVKGLTAELKIRYLQPVALQAPFLVRAFPEKVYGHFYSLKAELLQEGILKSKGLGKFLSFSEIPIGPKIGASRRVSSGYRSISRRDL